MEVPISPLRKILLLIDSLPLDPMVKASLNPCPEFSFEKDLGKGAFWRSLISPTKTKTTSNMQ
jgi:hypothetical protein